MRKLFRPLPALLLLLLACAAAHAQPSRGREGGPRAVRCPDDAMWLIHPSADKEHLTVEQEGDYEYGQKVKYLAVCGGSNDDFTRRVRQEVAGRGDAAGAGAAGAGVNCDEMLSELRKGLARSARYEGGRAAQNYEPAKEFLLICGDARRPFDRYLGEWVAKYDKAVRESDEKRRKGKAHSKGPAKEQ
jgi:hypothetical protein